MHTTRCVNAGHCPDRIVEAVQKQVATLDYAPTFNMGHPLAFEYAHRLASEMYPGKVRTHFGGQGGVRKFAILLVSARAVVGHRHVKRLMVVTNPARDPD